MTAPITMGRERNLLRPNICIVFQALAPSIEERSDMDADCAFTFHFHFQVPGFRTDIYKINLDRGRERE